MPKYDDDQCVNCGGVRVAKSTLCADCLAGYHETAEKEILIKKTLLEMYKTKIERLNGSLNEALAYGFKQNQENVKLNQHIQQLEKQITSSWEDGLW